MVPKDADPQAAIERERRRAEVRRQVEAGQLPALPDPTAEEMGDEAARLVKESRRKQRRQETREGE